MSRYISTKVNLTFPLVKQALDRLGIKWSQSKKTVLNFRTDSRYGYYGTFTEAADGTVSMGYDSDYDPALFMDKLNQAAAVVTMIESAVAAGYMVREEGVGDEVHILLEMEGAA